ncbi:MAG: carboxyl transferase, partial [Lachnospiraceae bacterium]|nr:carboxyl transferase [Lachnospiraceae bacterium]
MSNITALERIENMLDDHSFVELAPLVTSRTTDFNMNPAATPSDGVIIGHGLIDGNIVFIYSQDASVLGGSIGEMHAKKLRMIYDMAIKMGAPIIGFIDSTGVRLQESVDAVESIGMLYRIASKASGVIPQVLGIFGGCGGALSVLASICDFVYMSNDASRFMNAPDAITGNTKATLDTSCAQFQFEEAGSVDGIGSEVEVLVQIRQLISILPGSNRERGGYVMGCVDDPNRAAVGLEDKRDNIESFAKEISDDKLFIPIKSGYATDMTAGFIRLN